MATTSRAPARRGAASPGTSLQGTRTSYYRSGGTRTLVTSRGGGHQLGQRGREVRYQSPSGQRVVAQVPRKTYHRIILAEFATCVVLVAFSPVLTPRAGTSGARAAEGAAVSLAGPLVRLTAVCILFFALALMASGERAGKAAAAFGGLVTLGALLNATDMLTAVAKLFTGAAAASSTGAAAGGPEPTPTGAPPATGTTGNPIGEAG